MSYIKLARAAKKTTWGRYPRTYEAIIKQIPPPVIKRLTSSEIASLVDAWQGMFAAAGDAAVREFAAHHRIAGDIWGAELTQKKAAA